MKIFSKVFRMRGRKKPVTLLFWANWLLLGVSWGMSLYAYPRLPQEMAHWLSLWRGSAVSMDKSWTFFLFPLAQSFFFFGCLMLAARFFFAKFSADKKSAPDGGDKLRVLLDLRKEIVYLALIFFNLVFIHLQTTLILVSHRLSRGVNVSYLSMLIAVIVILIPYYFIRRKMILRFVP